MDYEKKYKEAISKAKDMLSYKEVRQEAIEYLFPELKESEDEKVKRIIHSISNKMSFHLRDIFTEEEFQCFDAWTNAWLEKQDGRKPAEWSEEDENCLSTIIAEFSKCAGKSVSKDEWMRCNDFLNSLRDRVFQK